MTKTQVPQADTELMDEIRRLAGTAVNHRLPADMLGSKPLARPAALMVLSRLRSHQPRSTDGSEPVQSSAPEPPCDQDAEPAGRKIRFGKFEFVEPGIYLYEGDVYRVYKSQYPPHHTKAKILLKHQDAGGAWHRDGWEYAKGMMGKLRPEHEMSAEDSRRFEELYGITVCTRCGAELENDESRELRIGPVCRTK